MELGTYIANYDVIVTILKRKITVVLKYIGALKIVHKNYTIRAGC